MKISIITPTYNRKDLLAETMKSVQAMTLIPLKGVEWEHIVYDDASTDGTQELFKGSSFPNTRYIRSDKNQGQSKTKNDAVMEATGEYIFFLDSDDIILSRTLYNFAVKALESPDAGWFIADFLRVDGSLRYIIGQDYFGWKFKDTNEMIDAIFKGEHFMQYCFMMKKSVFIEAGMCDPKLKMAQDIDLCLRVLMKGYMPVRCDFISHLHRFHESNMSNGSTMETHMKDMAMLKKKYEDAGLTPLV